MSPHPARRLGALVALQERLRLELAGSRSPGYTSAYDVLCVQFGYEGTRQDVAADVAMDIADLRAGRAYSWAGQR